MVWRLSPSRCLPQHVVWTVTILVFVALSGALVFSSRGLLHLWDLNVEEGVVRDRITELLRQNDHLQTRLHRLRTDDRYLEYLVRERLGFVRPGEIVYRFPDPAPDPPR